MFGDLSLGREALALNVSYRFKRSHQKLRGEISVFRSIRLGLARGPEHDDLQFTDYGLACLTAIVLIGQTALEMSYRVLKGRLCECAYETTAGTDKEHSGLSRYWRGKERNDVPLFLSRPAPANICSNNL